MTQRLRLLRGSVALFALAFILTGVYQPLTLQAQTNTAALKGTISDASGAGIPGATVSLESVARKLSRQTVTDATGTYVLPALEPDTYKLVVTAQGFTTQTTENITLDSGQGSTLNVTMQVGSSVTHVTVTEHAPLLDTTTATLGATIESSMVTDIPLSGRNFADMLLLVPGASEPNRSYYPGPSPVNPGESNFGDVAIYGQRPRSNLFTVDGIPDAETLFSGIPVFPPPEAIAEMKIQSGMDSGAYGWGAGANINTVTRSGGNAYHGDLWEFVQNNKLNARSWFSPTVGELRYNQFGGAAGGPIQIPHLVSKDKNWYVFGWCEGIRKPTVSPTYALVPTAAEENGNFSADSPIYNPYTSVVSSTGVLSARTPFAGNIIPTGATNVCSPHPTCFDAGASTIITSLLPIANGKPGQFPGGDDWLGNAVNDQVSDQWSARVDHQFGQKDSFYARYTDSRHDIDAYTFATLPSVTLARFTNIVGSETHSFSPTLLVTGRFGWTRSNWSVDTTGPEVATTAGTSAAFPIQFGGRYIIPPITISGYSGMSQGYSYYGPENLFAGTVDVQKIKGRHTIGFGGWYMHDHFRTNNQTGTSETFTNTPTQGVPSSGTGNPLASYFLGLPSSSGVVVGNTEGDMITPMYAVYVQDNFRATKKLTFNLGFRWDLVPPAINQHGSGTFEWETGTYVYDRTNPITGATGNAPRIGIIAPDYHNFQPRFGIAYQFDPKTTVRGSYGVFFEDVGDQPQSQQGNRGNWPYASPITVGSENNNLPQYFLENPFPPGSAASTTPQGCQQCLEVATNNTRTPYVQQWSLSVQRQVTPSLMWQTSYFGSHGIHEGGQIIDNTATTPGTNNYTLRQLYPAFPPYVNNGFNQFPSKYNGLSVELRKTASHGLTYLVQYTYSKSMDIMASMGVTSSANVDRFDIPLNWGPSTFNTTNRLTGSYVWAIPGSSGNKFADAVAAHWNFAGVYTYDSGSPVAIYLSADNQNIGTAGRALSFPNLVGNPTLSNRGPAEWFNPAAYVEPPFGTQGNAGRHAAYLDGMNNWDFSVYKRWPFLESRDVELRGEFLDGLNDHSFGSPTLTEDTTATFDKISSVRQGGRTIQFALKLHF